MILSCLSDHVYPSDPSLSQSIKTRCVLIWASEATHQDTLSTALYFFTFFGVDLGSGGPGGRSGHLRLAESFRLTCLGASGTLMVSR